MVKVESQAIEPYHYHADEAALDDLKLRLGRTIWPDEVAADPWRYGPPLAYVRNFVRYWLESYDWRAQEARLNAFPQFVTTIGEHRIHFIHQAGKGPAPIPLVITHGWPGSIVELLKIIPILT